jgi:hypothetical protein
MAVEAQANAAVSGREDAYCRIRTYGVSIDTTVDGKSTRIRNGTQVLR